MRKVKLYVLVFLTIAAFSAIKINSQTIKRNGLFSFLAAPENLFVVTTPSVVSITRASGNPSRWHHTVNYTVTFTEAVTGVEASDFALTTTGDIIQSPPNSPLSLPRVLSVAGSGATYTIAVYTGTWGTLGTKAGTLRLDLTDDDSITGAGGETLGGAGAGNGNFTSGEVYDLAVKSLAMRVELATPSNALVSEGFLPRASGGTDPCAQNSSLRNDLGELPPITMLDGRYTQYQAVSFNGRIHRLFNQPTEFLFAGARDSSFAATLYLANVGSLGISRPVGISMLINSRERFTYNAADDSFYYGTKIVSFPRHSTFRIDFQYGGYVDYVPNADGTYTWTTVSASGVRTVFTVIVPDATAPPTLDAPNLYSSSDDGASSCDDVTGIDTNLKFAYFADPNAEIQLLRDGAVVGAATTAANGEGVVTDEGVVPAGIHAYTLRQIVGGMPRNISYEPRSVTVRSRIPATVTADQAETQSDPAAASPVNFTVRFSEPVIGFDASDIIIGGTAVGDFNDQITVTGSGADYQISVGTQNTRRNGALSVSIPANAVTGTISVSNSASTSTDNIVTLALPDADGDGVTDSFDACPNTASGVSVNDAGCETEQCFAAPIEMNHWYAANENVPVNYADANRAGEIYGGVNFIQGRFGRAYSFDGSGRVLTSLTPANTLPSTYAAWVKPALRNDAADFPNNVVSTDRAGFYGHGFGLNVFPGGSQLKVEYNDGFRVVPDVSFNAGEWYHIAVVYTSGNVKTYVNGDLVDDYNFTQGAAEEWDAFWIGFHNLNAADSGALFRGAIDEVQAFSRALSPVEIKAIAAANSYGVCYPAAVAPIVTSIARVPDNQNRSAALTSTVDVAVVFSKPVTGVDAGDFVLTTTGSVSGAAISSVSGSGSSRTVSINRGTGAGTVRLDVIDDDTISDAANNRLGGTGIGNGNFTGGEVITLLAPTAAAVNISGRIVGSSGRGISGMLISITDASGDTRIAHTNPFGFYHFEKVQAGTIYVIRSQHKRFSFTPQAIIATEELNELNFVAQIK